MSRERNGIYIIAEVGSVHDGSFGNATRLIDLAASLGADCVKFQTHLAAAETTRDAPMPHYFKGEPRFEYFERTGFRREQWKQLKAHAESKGLEFLSSPFSIEAVELLEDIGVNGYKIPSGEVTNLPMLDVIGQTGKPVLVSSGMSNWTELDAAISVIRKHHDRVTPMQCTSAYPCSDDRVGLNVIAEMRKRWNLPVGYSDHTLDNHAAFAAVALGAIAVEKHLTFSKAMYGSDAPHSAEPPQFTDLVKGLRAIGSMLASRVDKDDLAPYRSMKQIFEKSVVARDEIKAGSTITHAMLAAKKPGDGIPAARIAELVGRTARIDLPADRVLRGDDVEPPLAG